MNATAKAKPFTVKAKSIIVILIALYFFLSPLEDVLNFGGGTILRYLAGLIVLTILWDDSLSSRSLIINRDIKYVLYFIALGWLSVIWARDRSYAITRNIAYSLLPILFIFVIKRKYSQSEINVIETAIISGGVVAVAFIIASQGLSNMMAGRLVIMEESDPNGLAGRLILSLILAIKRIIVSKTLGSKLLNSLTSILLLIICLMTGSRGALLALAVSVTTYAAFMPFENKWRKMILLTSALLLAWQLINVFLPIDLIERLFEIDSYANSVDSSGQRGEIWKNIFEHVLPNMPLLGYGSGGGPVVLENIYRYRKGVHNTYINNLLEYGVLGLPVLLAFLWRLWRKMRKNKDVFRLCAFTSILVVAFFLDVYANKFFWNMLMYCSIGTTSDQSSKNLKYNDRFHKNEGNSWITIS